MMNSDQYLETAKQVFKIARLCAAVDAAGLLKTMDEIKRLAPILDPTLIAEEGEALEISKKIAGHIAAIRKIIERDRAKLS